MYLILKTTNYNQSSRNTKATFDDTEEKVPRRRSMRAHGRALHNKLLSGNTRRSSRCSSRASGELSAAKRLTINTANEDVLVNYQTQSKFVVSGSPSLANRRVEDPPPTFVDPTKRHSQMRKQMLHGKMAERSLADTPTTSPSRRIEGGRKGQPDRGSNLIDCTFNLRRVQSPKSDSEKKGGLGDLSPERESTHISQIMHMKKQLVGNKFSNISRAASFKF